MASGTDIAQRTDSGPDDSGGGEPAAGYFAATAVPAPRRAPLAHDLDVDVCVIGGGLAGLTAAREIARRGWSVALLEGKRIAWEASGRNTGFVLPGFAQDAATIVERVGQDHARELWALSQRGLDYVRRTIAEGDMAGVAQSEGWLYVSKTGRPLADEASLLRGLGADIELWPEALVRSRLKSGHYFQAIHFPTALNIHPLNYARGLAALAEQAGARIFEETTALSIDPAGVRKRVVTAGGRVRAARIVLAGNVHLGSVMPDISSTLLPVRTFVVATAPLGDRLAQAIDYRGSVSDTDWADNHYRALPDGRLIWSGRMTVWDGKARRYRRGLCADIRRRFPQLGEVEIEHAWSGTLGATVHRMPQIGEVAAGVWLASGFGGHGLNTTAMAGELIARAVVEGDDAWRLFLPFELVFAGGRTGRLVLQAAYWGSRVRDALAAHAARRNEARRMREEAQRREREDIPPAGAMPD